MSRLIDADALIKYLGRPEDDRDRSINLIIDRAPTVATEPVRHAAWEYCEESDSDKCTNCGFEVSRGYGYNKPDWKHCPNCTARMDLDAAEKEDSNA